MVARFPLKDFMGELRAQLGEGSIESVYREQILRLRTRAVRLFGRKCNPKIIYTFLGYELKARRRRITCPDLVTARYLKIFAEIGLREICIPLDPTQTERWLPDLERALALAKSEIQRSLPHDALKQSYALRLVYADLRRALRAGAGECRSTNVECRIKNS